MQDFLQIAERGLHEGRPSLARKLDRTEALAELVRALRVARGRDRGPRSPRPIFWPRMQLYLVRHAEAAQGEPDELRPLTAAGREQARSLGVRLREEGVQPDAILTSPSLRARETGNLLARELGVRARPEERLAPGATAAAVAEAAREGGETIVAVGHQPDCGQIAAALTGEPEPEFPPTGVAAILL